MRRLPAALAGLAATAFLGAPALAHHSQAMFDTSKEILIKGTVDAVRMEEPAHVPDRRDRRRGRQAAARPR